MSQSVPGQRRPTVSVIIPTFNRDHCIRRAIDSVLCQTFSDFELIVVDNFSTDKTWQLLSSYNDSRLSIFKTHNYGVIATSRNYGIALSTGKYLAFLDSDDWWTPRKLEVSVTELENGFDLVFSDLLVVRSNSGLRTSPSLVKYWKLRHPLSKDLFLFSNPIACSTVVVKADLFKSLGGFSEETDLIAAEDYDAWIQLASINSRFSHIPLPLVYYQLSPDSTSSHWRTITYTRFLLAKYQHLITPGRFPLGLHYELAKAHFSQRCYGRALQTFASCFLSGALHYPFRHPYYSLRSSLYILLIIMKSCRLF